MQTLSFQQNNRATAERLTFQFQQNERNNQKNDHHAICSAVRAWAAVEGRVAVALAIKEAVEDAALVGIDTNCNADVWNVKLFRWLDNKEKSPVYRANVEQLEPVITSVLPLEFRSRLTPRDDFMTRYAAMEKEVSEAKRAVMLNAPQHQMVKEVREGIEHLLGLLPVEAMAQVVSGLAALTPGLL